MFRNEQGLPRQYPLLAYLRCAMLSSAEPAAFASPDLRLRIPLLLALGASLALSLALVLGRVLLSHEVRFLFLLWNLFLALIPFVLSSLLALSRGPLRARLLLPVFAAAVLGGLGSLPGAVGGALLLGIAEELTAAYLSPAYRQAVGFLAILLVLTLRPAGLTGRAVRAS